MFRKESEREENEGVKNFCGEESLFSLKHSRGFLLIGLLLLQLEAPLFICVSRRAFRYLLRSILRGFDVGKGAGNFLTTLLSP